MHGVAKHLAGLRDFVGLTLLSIDDREYIVYFRFGNGKRRPLEIGVEGGWHVRDAAGNVVVRGSPRPGSRVGAPPLGTVVVDVETVPPRAIRLRLDCGQTLQIDDDSDSYESFSIPHANVYI